jgi:hypothetical protein
MSKQDRQKLSILVILLVVLALTVVLGYRMSGPAVTAAVQVPETKTSANPPAPTDARIRLDLIETPEASKEEVGRKNVFQYGQTRQTTTAGSSAPRGGGSTAATPGTPSTPVTPPPAITPPPGPVAPPPPPPVPLKYHGYAIENSSRRQMTAFLVDDTSHHYNVNVGEILMGRYRVAQISTGAVEIEDIQNNRRQTLPLLK